MTEKPTNTPPPSSADEVSPPLLQDGPNTVEINSLSLSSSIPTTPRAIDSSTCFPPITAVSASIPTQFCVARFLGCSAKSLDSKAKIPKTFSSNNSSSPTLESTTKVDCTVDAYFLRPQRDFPPLHELVPYFIIPFSSHLFAKHDTENLESNLSSLFQQARHCIDDQFKSSSYPVSVNESQDNAKDTHGINNNDAEWDWFGILREDFLFFPKGCLVRVVVTPNVGTVYYFLLNVGITANSTQHDIQNRPTEEHAGVVDGKVVPISKSKIQTKIPTAENTPKNIHAKELTEKDQSSIKTKLARRFSSSHSSSSSTQSSPSSSSTSSSLGLIKDWPRKVAQLRALSGTDLGYSLDLGQVFRAYLSYLRRPPTVLPVSTGNRNIKESSSTSDSFLSWVSSPFNSESEENHDDEKQNSDTKPNSGSAITTTDVRVEEDIIESLREEILAALTFYDSLMSCLFGAEVLTTTPNISDDALIAAVYARTTRNRIQRAFARYMDQRADDLAKLVEAEKAKNLPVCRTLREKISDKDRGWVKTMIEFIDKMKVDIAQKYNLIVSVAKSIQAAQKIHTTAEVNAGANVSTTTTVPTTSSSSTTPISELELKPVSTPQSTITTPTVTTPPPLPSELDPFSKIASFCKPQSSESFALPLFSHYTLHILRCLATPESEKDTNTTQNNRSSTASPAPGSGSLLTRSATSAAAPLAVSSLRPGLISEETYRRFKIVRKTPALVLAVTTIRQATLILDVVFVGLDTIWADARDRGKVLASGAGGVVGAVSAGQAGGTIGAAIGTAVLPGIGTLIGFLAGGILSGIAGGKGGSYVTGKIYEKISPGLETALDEKAERLSVYVKNLIPPVN